MTITKGLLSGGKKEKKKEEYEVPEQVDYLEKEQTVADRFYGIKSYLHQFYDWSRQSSEEDEQRYLFAAERPKRKVVYICRAAFIIGLTLLLLGAVAIIVSHLWPVPTNAYGPGDFGEGDTAIRVYFYQYQNQDMFLWKVVGLVVFACGGAVIVTSLLIPLCCKGKWEAANHCDAGNMPIKVYPRISESGDAQGVPARPPKDQSKVSGPVARNIPVMEEVQPVQPTTGKVRRVSDEDMLLNQ